MPELIWHGKYDEDGHRVAPLRLALPFQTVETVNESAIERQKTLNFFDAAGQPDWRNRLIWGDRKYVLPSLCEELAGKVDLVYIDPPFALGADFSFPVHLNGEDFTKQPSVIEQKAYRDTWSVTAEDRTRGVTPTDRYLNWFYETVALLHTLLSPSGSIYVHLDWHIEHYAKLILDEVFGSENYRNDIAWRRDAAGKGAKRVSNQWPRNSDRILFYVKDSAQAYFSQQYVPLTDDQKRPYRYADPDGRLFKAVQLGDYSPASIEKMRAENLIYRSASGQDYKKYYLDEAQGTLDELWTDILGFGVRTAAAELTGFPTQKPLELLRRIISASSREGDIVLDCFCGSGTTAVAAELLGRRWIAADLGRFAIHSTRKRLLAVEHVRPFVVQNLGKYERQHWQAAEFGAETLERSVAYRRFIIEAFNARSVEGYSWLHGIKQGRMIHVGSVDSPVTAGDVKQIAAEFRRAVGSGKDAPSTAAVDILGWDFAFELNEVARQEAGRAGIEMRFWRIPREILDKRAVEEGDIHFFELAALEVDLEHRGRRVEVCLTGFVIPLEDVPEDVQRSVTDWSQWIDYWAVDWNNQGDTFHNEWQAFRTRKEPRLPKSAIKDYENAGYYQVVIKVIDILGNDTTKTLKVEVT